MKHFRILRIAAIALGLGTVVAFAHQGATGIVKERMDQMKGVAQSMKALGAMFKGEVTYDAELVQSLATEIAKSSGTELSVLFPKNSIMPPSEALPEIWSDWGRFEDLSNKMQASAVALANGAANPEDGSIGPKPADLFKDLAGTCKSCHQDFRIKK